MVTNSHGDARRFPRGARNGTTRRPAERQPTGWRALFGSMKGEVRDLLREPVERLASAAQEEADLVIGAARAEARQMVFGAKRAAVLAGAAAIAGVLLVIGLSGALGELFGRAWAGQLATGGLVLVGAGVYVLVSKRRAHKDAEEAQDEARSARAGSDGRPSLAGLLVLASTGFLASRFLAEPIAAEVDDEEDDGD